MTKYELGDHKGAIVDYDEAIRLDSTNASTWHCRGLAKLGLGDEQGASADLNEAKNLGFIG